MPRHYSAELRRQACGRVITGEALNDLGGELGITMKTLFEAKYERSLVAQRDRTRAGVQRSDRRNHAGSASCATDAIGAACPDPPPQSTNTPVVIAATMPSTARAASCL
jgi:hypothetical protein